MNPLFLGVDQIQPDFSKEEESFFKIRSNHKITVHAHENGVIEFV
jgi:hypothetical protein